MGEISFMLIRFTSYEEVYLVDASIVGQYYFNEKTRSIPYEIIKSKGYRVPLGYLAEIDYLKIVDQVYFNEKD